MRIIRQIFLCAVALFWAVPLMAQEKFAVVIANGSYAETPLAKPVSNGILVSRSLFGLGFDVVRHENTNAIDRPISGRKADTVIIYFSGKIDVREGKTYLLSVNQLNGSEPDDWVLDEMVLAYLNAGSKRVLVFLDTCHPELANLKPQQAVGIKTPEVFQAQAAEPGSKCLTTRPSDPAFTNRLLKVLLTSDLSLADAFLADETIWTTSTLSQPYILLQADKRSLTLSAEDLKMLERLSDKDRESMLALWRSAGIISNEGQPNSATPTTVGRIKNDTIILTAPVKPVNVVFRVSPIIPVMQTGNAVKVQNGIRVFNPVSAPIEEFQPTIAGLPEPSILVGIIRKPDEPSAPIKGQETLTSLTGSISIEERQRMRAEDPERFIEILNAGAFDPPSGGLPRAIQTELARMGCYTSRIDGVWGAGSRNSVSRYFKQRAIVPTTREPATELFRQIVSKDDVRCPIVQTTGIQTMPRQTAPVLTVPNIATPNPPKINQGTSASGVFR